MRLGFGAGVAAMVSVLGLHAVATAQAGGPSQQVPGAVKQLEPGAWQLRDPEGGVRKFCLTNPAMLLQLMHGNAQCEHVVMEESPTAATVRYLCPGHGHGRTLVQVESRQLVTIDTQGVNDGNPFATQFEVRRIGACR